MLANTEAPACLKWYLRKASSAEMQSKIEVYTLLSLVNSISRRNRKTVIQLFVFKRCLVNGLLFLRDILSNVKGRKGGVFSKCFNT